MNTYERSPLVLPLVAGENGFHKDLSVLQNVIGQDEARKKLMFFIKSHSQQTPFPTMLFTGSQGLGKSYAAGKIADALGRELIEVNCGSCETTKSFIEDVLRDRVLGEKSKTILLDEAHKLSSEVTTILLTFLNPNKQNKNYFAYKNLMYEYDFSKINVVFATTDAHKMFRPLLNRCTEIYFHPYSNDELFDILGFYLPDINLRCSKEDIAYACRGRARDAFLLSQNVQRYCNMRNTGILNKKGWEEIKDIFGIYPKGLNSQEIELMDALQEYGPISCHNLAVILKVNEKNVESELEVRPRELGFIENSAKGRCLTVEGEKYLAKNNSK